MLSIIKQYIKDRYKINRRKTFELGELETYLLQKLGGETAYSSAGGYHKLSRSLKNLADEGLIGTVKNSPLNGKKPPLKTRWRILIDNSEAGWDSKRFFRYSDLLDLSFYERNPGYQTEEEWQKIESVYNFLREREEREWASLEERSLELFADEKYLSNSRNKAVLSWIKVSLADLKARKYGEMFIYWQMLKGSKVSAKKQPDLKGQQVLILENHSTFFSCKRVLQEGRDILGKYYNMLIYGEGKKIIKSLSFLEEISTAEDIQLFYFGDIDPEGFMIYRLLKERYPGVELELCLPLYRELLQAAETSYPCSNQRRNEKDLKYILDEIDAGKFSEEVRQLKELWYNSKRLPQELITYEYLLKRSNL